MRLTVAIQMDPIETIDVSSDSTFLLAVEAQDRGHQLFYYLPEDLTLKMGKIIAPAKQLSVTQNKNPHFLLKEKGWIELSTLDVILMRQDPPFDMAYITATHFLEQVHPRTLVVNDPASVRNSPEKLLVTEFPQFMPPTLISSNMEQINSFRQEHKDLIIKPLFGNGGAGVFRIKPEDENFYSLLELYKDIFKEPIIVQRYEAKVRDGDKRIVLIDGNPVGAVNRIPPSGEVRSNLHVGGRPAKAKLTKRDQEICEAIGPELKRKGLIFVGIDVIGNHITEINVTSPTCLQEINHFDGVNLERDIWDSIEEKIKK